jgi:hypothetical protein
METAFGGIPELGLLLKLGSLNENFITCSKSRLEHSYSFIMCFGLYFTFTWESVIAPVEEFRSGIIFSLCSKSGTKKDAIFWGLNSGEAVSVRGSVSTTLTAFRGSVSVMSIDDSMMECSLEM